MSWKEIVEYLQNTMDVYVDEEEGFFECPECGDPIYECDWEGYDFHTCPVCEYDFFDYRYEEEEYEL